ncbi:response regulator [Tautonia rosea]|uniref:response regulator n=1 Tax=Tautonia rosea TaxID=2728037 RepID=UPI0014739EEF|nr:response regulator [Tautonia rosea]
MSDRETHAPKGPDGILLCQDLIFTSKITGTARELGYRVLVAGTDPLAQSMLEQWRPKVVLVDLSHPHFAKPDVLLAYRKIVPTARFLAFGSHVDVKSLSAARDVGCDPVLPRSKFTAELPELIQTYLGEASCET